jgi:hypothetical protein
MSSSTFQRSKSGATEMALHIPVRANIRAAQFVEDPADHLIQFTLKNRNSELTDMVRYSDD